MSTNHIYHNFNIEILPFPKIFPYKLGPGTSAKVCTQKSLLLVIRKIFQTLTNNVKHTRINVMVIGALVEES